MIRFPCGTCGRRLRVPARLAGKRGRCERCGAINRVPLADVPSPDGETAHEAPPEPVHDEVPAEAPAAAVESPLPPSPPNEDVREPPAAPPEPKVEPARSFSTDAVPTEESAAVEVAPPAFGIDEAVVFPPVGEFEKVPDADFSHVPAAPSPAGAQAQPVEAVPASGADDPSPGGADGDVEVEIEPAPEPEPEPEIEPEPEVVPVDVRRAAASPFRTTADMRPREMIEGSVEVSGAQFAAATLPATVGPGSGSGGGASTFLELVAQRMGVIHQPAPGAAAQALTQRHHPPADSVESEDEEPVIRILHIDVDDEPPRPRAREAAPAARVRVPESRRPAPPVARAALPPASAVAAATLSARRAVVTALVIGLIIGFVLGLVVADLL